jgi:hypothetical protein
MVSLEDAAEIFDVAVGDLTELDGEALRVTQVGDERFVNELDLHKAWGSGAITTTPHSTTRLHRGGLLWWFLCPVPLGRGCCGRRVRKLYLPPGGHYFGCRDCHNLTYRSAQEHDKRVDALRRDRRALRARMNDLEGLSTGELLLALKAVRLAGV